MTLAMLYEFAAETAASMTMKHPDYTILAARIALRMLYMETNASFSETVKCLYKAKKVSKELYEFVMLNFEELDPMIDHTRDDEFTYFGYQTLVSAYFICVDKKIFERPQHMWMRV